MYEMAGSRQHGSPSTPSETLLRILGPFIVLNGALDILASHGTFTNVDGKANQVDAVIAPDGHFGRLLLRHLAA